MSAVSGVAKGTPRGERLSGVEMMRIYDVLFQILEALMRFEVLV